MFEFKGTRGPWRLQDLQEMLVKECEESGTPQFFTRTQYLYDSNGDILADIKGFDCSGFVTPDEEPFNAQLIASAPELLEALEDLRLLSTNLFKELTIDEVEQDECLQRLSVSIDNAYSIINKAKGKGAANA